MRRGSSAIRITGHPAQSQQLRPRCHQRTSSPPAATPCGWRRPYSCSGGRGKHPPANESQGVIPPDLPGRARHLYRPRRPRRPEEETQPTNPEFDEMPTILGRTTKISAPTDPHRARFEPHTKNILFAFLSPSVLTLLGFSFSQLRTDP